MNRLIFEGRFLVNLVGGIMRQNDLKTLHGRLDWERMYRIADYHRIANIVYLGLLGNGEKVPERWQERFFERYQESLRFGDVYRETEKEILTLLDMMKVPCIILTTSKVRDLYAIPEMASINPLRIMMNEESYTLAKGYLVDLGYETDRIYKGYGERMRRVSGFYVEIYHKLPFYTRLYEKNMQRILETAYIRRNSEFIRTLSLESRYIFMMAQAVYHYVGDELLIREILDLYLYHKMWRDEMNEEFIFKNLSDFQIEQIAEKILHIAYMWFGVKEEIFTKNQPDDMSVYDVLENRILSRGEISLETDKQAVRLAYLIQRDKDRERRRDKWEMFKERVAGYWDAFCRKLRWLFPEYKYMCAIYPFLEKLPILLPVYWLRRGARLLISIFVGRQK